jgi:phage tail sheath gpL-like
MAISFDRIPANIRTPGVYTEIDSSQAVRGVQLIPFRYMLLGQKIAAGSATALTAVRVTSVAQARTLFGPGSMLAIMVEAAIASNNFSELWCMPMADNGAGVSAAGALTFGGAPTESGTISVYVGGKRVQIGATSTDTPASLATALATAITADTTRPSTAPSPRRSTSPPATRARPGTESICAWATSARSCRPA